LCVAPAHSGVLLAIEASPAPLSREVLRGNWTGGSFLFLGVNRNRECLHHPIFSRPCLTFDCTLSAAILGPVRTPLPSRPRRERTKIACGAIRVVSLTINARSRWFHPCAWCLLRRRQQGETWSADTYWSNDPGQCDTEDKSYRAIATD